MVYGMDDQLSYGRIKGKTPRQLIEKNKRKIFDLIKNGFSFDDDVLKNAGITKKITNVRVYNSFCDHYSGETKKMPKERLSYDRIMEELSMTDAERFGNN